MDLVAGYSSSSDEEVKEKPKVILPSASQVLDKVNQASVLESKYEKKKKQEDFVLEQHVKMVETSLKADQGKKICWLFKKGRCKFGEKCKHRHDRLSADLIERKNPPPNLADTANESDDRQPAKNKKRYGVSDSLVPPKKALKQFHSIQHKKI